MPREIDAPPSEMRVDIGLETLAIHRPNRGTFVVDLAEDILDKNDVHGLLLWIMMHRIHAMAVSQESLTSQVSESVSNPGMPLPDAADIGKLVKDVMATLPTGAPA